MTCVGQLIVSLAPSQIKSESVLHIREFHKAKMLVARNGAINEIVKLEGEGVI
jgi:hypothetical protein